MWHIRTSDALGGRLAAEMMAYSVADENKAAQANGLISEPQIMSAIRFASLIAMTGKCLHSRQRGEHLGQSLLTQPGQPLAALPLPRRPLGLNCANGMTKVGLYGW